MFVSLDSHQAYFDLLGPESGPVVLLVHSLASDSGMWAEQVPALVNAGFRVLRMDIRGHGGSEAPASPYTMKQLGDDAAKLMDRLGIDKVHFVGLSIGGMIAQGFALDHPGKLLSLTICDALPGSPPNAKELWAPRIGAVSEAKSLAPVASGTIERWLSAEFRQRKPQRWQQIHDTIIGTKPDGFIGCATAITDFDFSKDLPSIKIPTLVICGAQDPGAPPAMSKQIAASIPGARYEEVDGALHFPNVEKPDAFNSLLLDWVGSGKRA